MVSFFFSSISVLSRWVWFGVFCLGCVFWFGRVLVFGGLVISFVCLVLFSLSVLFACLPDEETNTWRQS